MTDIKVGDVVRLGVTAREKQYVLRVWADGTVQVRQASTGAVRNVRADRCVPVIKPAPAPVSPWDRCPTCGDFYAWCPERPELHHYRTTD